MKTHNTAVCQLSLNSSIVFPHNSNFLCVDTFNQLVWATVTAGISLEIIDKGKHENSRVKIL